MTESWTNEHTFKHLSWELPSANVDFSVQVKDSDSDTLDLDHFEDCHWWLVRVTLVADLRGGGDL